MRAALDTLYRLSGLAAGFFLVVVAALSLMQVSGRLLGFAAHSFDEFAGYCMAASTFLGLTWTLRANEQIRMTLVHDRLPGGLRRGAEVLCLATAVFIIGYFAWASVDMAWTSFKLNEPSQGLVPIKLWIPQSAMAGGLAVLLLAFVDDLLVALAGGKPSYETAQPPADATASFER